MNQAFESAFSLTVIGQEGGFVLSTLKHDSGGMTYAGISRNNFPEWGGWALIDAGDTGSNYLHQLAKDFYLGFAWSRLSLDQLPQRIAALVFDFAVNSGRTVAVQRLQRLLLVKDDGVMGIKTVIAVRASDPTRLALRYLAARLDFLNDLSAWAYFGKGWSQRIVNLMNFAAE